MSHGTTGGKGFVPPSPEELDAILDGYEFLEMLGRGGMGAVYKARQKSLDRLVAIKILPPFLASDGEEDAFHFAERFQREARAMAKLSHPNIIGVYDFGQARDGQCYFVMEYVEGTDLHHLIQGGELTVDHVAGWVSQICDALQYAHSRGIVHRDIKPANIMVTLEGQVKVADFGLAKLTGGEETQTKLTMTNMAMGTPDYVAPEVLEAGTEVDHRADLYAVGVMLYEMLTGKVPRGAWKPASTQIPGLDPRYDELIERAMDADREGRYQQASEIGATIYEIAATPPPSTAPKRTLLVGAPAEAKKAAIPTSASAPSEGDGDPVPAGIKRSRKSLGISLAFAAVVLVAGLAGVLRFGSEEPAAESLAPAASVPSEALPPTGESPATIATDEPARPVAPVPLPSESAPPAVASLPAAALSAPVMEPANAESVQAPGPPMTAAAPGSNPSPAAAAIDPVPPPARPSEPDSPEPAPRPVVPEDPRLAQLESGFKARLEKDADEPFRTAVAALDRSYVANGLFRARAAAQQKGLLDEVTALDLERTRVERGDPLPPVDLDSLPVSLKNLRTTYREALAKSTSERNIKAAPVYDLYLGALDAYVAELTKANAIERAREVKSLRDRVATEKSGLSQATGSVAPASPTLTTTAAPNPPTVASPASPLPPEVLAPPAPPAHTERIVEWLRKRGGRFGFDDRGNRGIIGTANPAEFPKGAKLWLIDSAVGPRETEFQMAWLEGETELEELWLWNLPDIDTVLPLRGMDRLHTFSAGTEQAVLDDDRMKVWPPLPALRFLGLRPAFTGGGLRILCERCPALESVYFRDFEFTGGEELHPLQLLQRLKSIKFERARLSPENVASLGSLTGLENLSLFETPVAGLDLSALENLVVLEVNLCRFDDPGLAGIQSPKTLREILFRNNELTDASLAVAARHPKVVRLDLGFNRLTGEGIEQLRPLRELEYLHLMGNRLTDEALSRLPDFPDLVYLDLQLNPELGDAAGVSIGKSKILRELQLGGTGIGDPGLQAVCEGARKIMILNLATTKVTDAGIPSLRRLERLEVLYLQETALTDASVETLKSLKSLRELSLAKTQITANGVAALREALPDCQINTQ